MKAKQIQKLRKKVSQMKNFSMQEFEETMKGVYTTSVVASTLDEAPQAYKSIDEIMSAIADTVDIVEVLKPVYNYKAH